MNIEYVKYFNDNKTPLIDMESGERFTCIMGHEYTRGAVYDNHQIKAIRSDGKKSLFARCAEVIKKP